MGGRAPNYQGLFLRGHGGQNSNHWGTVYHGSGALGVVQGDTIRPITGRVGASKAGNAEGPFVYDAQVTTYAAGRNASHFYASFDVSRVTPVASEIRPINTAVRYLIRAR